MKHSVQILIAAVRSRAVLSFAGQVIIGLAIVATLFAIVVTTRNLAVQQRDQEMPGYDGALGSF
jgi:hypothetical protein